MCRPATVEGLSNFRQVYYVRKSIPHPSNRFLRKSMRNSMDKTIFSVAYIDVVDPEGEGTAADRNSA